MKQYPHSYVQMLADQLDQLAGEPLRCQILEGAEKLTAKTGKAPRAAAFKVIMERMDATLDHETAVQARKACACKPPSFLKEAKAILAASPDVDSFLAEVEKKRFLGSPLIYEGNRITGEFGFKACVCSKVGGAKEPLPMLWCECCKGHIEWMYINLFGPDVVVDLYESVITGGSECRYTVTLS